MLDLNIEILEKSVEAFIDKDSKKAKAVAKLDDKIDEFHDIYLDHLLTVEKMHLDNNALNFSK